MAEVPPLPLDAAADGDAPTAQPPHEPPPPAEPHGAGVAPAAQAADALPDTTVTSTGEAAAPSRSLLTEVAT